MSKLFMSENKIALLLKASRNHTRDYAIFQVALATGFRVSDLVRIKRVDVAPDDRNVADSIRIKMKKTGRMIERPLPQACKQAIKDYLETRNDPNPFLFRSESNNSKDITGPMDRSSLRRLFKSYLRILYSNPSELRGNACHVTRRSMAKIISDKAGRIEPATKFLGHTSIANTISYLDMDGYGKQANEIIGELPWNKTLDMGLCSK